MSAQAIAEPGVYDLPIEQYHADPVVGGSLSHSGARLLLPPSCPAKFAYTREHGRTETRREWDFGHAAHRLALGAGPEFVQVDRERWDTNAVKEEVAAIRAAGKVPIKPSDADHLAGMVAALRKHPLAGPLLDPERMEPERTLVWRDEHTGLWCRALVDALPRQRGGRVIVADYKTADSAEPERIGRAMADYGYHIQGAWYPEGAVALGLADKAVFVLIVQEKTPPYLVTVAEPDAPSIRIGRRLSRQARETYVECSRTGRWPAYPVEPGSRDTTDSSVALVELPPWEARKHEEATW